MWEMSRTMLALKATQEKSDATKRQRLEEIVRKLEATN
jgi:hypothetical protein